MNSVERAIHELAGVASCEGIEVKCGLYVCHMMSAWVHDRD